MEDIFVLYVEDDEKVRELTLSLLQEVFSNIKVAENGQEALGLFEGYNFDLVITDINMPIMNGIELIKHIREKNKQIPIIILTAYDDNQYILEAIKYNVDGYILKPIDLQQFIDTIDKVVQKIKLAKENENLMTLLLQYQKAIDDFFIVSKTDINGNITYVNKKFENISQYSKDELIGKNHRIVRHPDMPKEIFTDLWSTIKQGKKWSGIIKNKSKSGKPYYVDTVIIPIKDKAGNILEYFSIRQDITNSINPQKKLHLSVNPEKPTLISIFKIQNYSYLEDIYDFESLSNIEWKLKQIIRNLIPSDCKIKDVINLGGGEFVVIREFEYMPSEEFVNHIVEKFRHLPEEIQKEAYKIIDYDLIIKVSVAYGKDAYKMAKYGIRKLEETGEDIVVVNDIQEKIKQEAENNLKILKKVKTAIEKDKIVVYFQPIVDNKTRQIAKFEALVRVIDEENKILTPYIFLNLIKNTKLYTDLSKQIIIKSLKAQIMLKKPVSINLSYKDIENIEIKEFIYKVLDKTKESSQNITFEIVETEDIKDHKLVEEFIKYVKNVGVRLAIDDFGEGYSNLKRIMSYNPDFIKIDGSLIKKIDEDRNSVDLVKALVDFCKSKGYKTIAEFVENEKIYEILKIIGVDYSQGYYFGKPQPLEYWMKNGK